MDALMSDYGSCGYDHAEDDNHKRDGGANDENPGRNTRLLASLLILLVVALSAASLAVPSSPPSSASSATLARSADDDRGDGVQKIVYIVRHGEKIYDPANATAYDYACLSRRGRARADHLVATFLGPDGPRADVPGALVVPAALFSFNYDNGELDCVDPVDRVYRTEATLRPLGRALGISIDNRHGAKPDLCGLGTIQDAPGITDRDATLLDFNHQICHHPAVTGSVHDFGMCCNLGAAEAIRRKLFEDPSKISAVLVAWEHANIGYLAEALMTDDEDERIGQRDLDVAAFVSANADFRRMMDWPDASFDAIWALRFDPETQKFASIVTDTYAQGFGD